MASMDSNRRKKLHHRYLSSPIVIYFKSECFLNKFDSRKELLLNVDGRQFVVHRELLCLKSDYFKTMLNSDWTVESRQNEITLQETPYRLFRQVLESFYSDSIEIPVDFSILDVYELYYLYKRLLFFAPAEALLNNFSSILDRYSWRGAWYLLDNVSIVDDGFFRACMSWIQNNQENWPTCKTPFSCSDFRAMSIDTLKRFLDYNSQFYEVFFLLACLKWIQHNKPEIEQCIELFDKIRFAFLEWKYLQHCFDNIFFASDLTKHLAAKWTTQMKLLLSVDPRFRAVNDGWKFPFAKDICYTTNFSYVKMRGICVYDDNIINQPIQYETPENLGIKSDQPMCIVDLRLPFWLNEIGLKLKENSSSVRCQYLLEYSVDGHDWNALFDYREYICTGNQLLIFKPTVVRYLRISGKFLSQSNNSPSMAIDSIHDLTACYRKAHNSYSYGLKQGLYFSPYHIFAIKNHIFSFKTMKRQTDRGRTHLEQILITEQPVLVNKYLLEIPDGFQIGFSFEIFNHKKKTFDLIYDRPNDLCEKVRVIRFIDRPVNMIRIVVKNIVASEAVKDSKFNFKSHRFFDLEEVRSTLPVYMPESSREFP